MSENTHESEKGSGAHDLRLSNITTHWEGIAAAQEDGQAKLRNEVLLRYAGCVYQYILGATRNPDVAEDLAQEFALRFMSGGFAKVDPAKGRFRDYLKTSLRNLVTDHFRRRSVSQLSTSKAEHLSDELAENQLDKLESKFQSHWRQQALGHAWQALRQFEEARGNYYFTVLKMRAEKPGRGSGEISQLISSQFGKAVTADWVRQKLHRARQKFAELLVAEVRRSLVTNDEDLIQQELVDLGLQKYMHV